jgi:hypothetical protein
MGGKSHTYRDLVGKPEGKRIFGKTKRDWNVDIKMNSEK